MTSPIPSSKLSSLRRNLFEASHAAIDDWQQFPWHRDKRNEVQADKPNSSQALAIDVFGSIKAADQGERDAVLDSLATEAELPHGGPWKLELEWTDPDNQLREPRQTQVDAIAIGARAVMVIECKFTEPGGACSQTRKIASGPGAGERQCDGNYAPQINPRTLKQASCALSGKGIRYWEVIPSIFDLNASATYSPCPFKRETFQWMRNMALAHELGRVSGKSARCLIAYARGGVFPTEVKARDLGWLPKFADGTSGPHCISYQEILALAGKATGSSKWMQLSQWVNDKVSLAVGNR
ncbi:MAG: PGN_0703 family putative restriction endonuclease [Erythrobacter sp.]